VATPRPWVRPRSPLRRLTAQPPVRSRPCIREVPCLPTKTCAGGDEGPTSLVRGHPGSPPDNDGDGLLDIFLVERLRADPVAGAHPPPQCPLPEPRHWRFEDVSHQAGVRQRGWAAGSAPATSTGRHLDVYVPSSHNLLFQQQRDGTFREVAAPPASRPRLEHGLHLLRRRRGRRPDLYVARTSHLRRARPCGADGNLLEERATDHGGAHGAARRGRPPSSRTRDGTFVRRPPPTASPTRQTPTASGWCQRLRRRRLADLFVANDSNRTSVPQRGTVPSRAWGFPRRGRRQREGGTGGMGVTRGTTTATADRPRPDTVRRPRHQDPLTGTWDGASSRTSASARAWPLRRSRPWAGAPPSSTPTSTAARPLPGERAHLPERRRRTPDAERDLRQRTSSAERGTTFRDRLGSRGGGLQVRKSSRGLAVGDLDDDGDLDVVVSNMDDVPTVLENRSEPGTTGWPSRAVAGEKPLRDRRAGHGGSRRESPGPRDPLGGQLRVQRTISEPTSAGSWSDPWMSRSACREGRCGGKRSPATGSTCSPCRTRPRRASRTTRPAR